MKELKIFDKPENIKRVINFFYVLLALLLISEFFIHKHPEFPWEGELWFFAVFGFVSCVAVIFTAKLLRVFAKKDEKYYD